MGSGELLVAGGLHDSCSAGQVALEAGDLAQNELEFAKIIWALLGTHTLTLEQIHERSSVFRAPHTIGLSCPHGRAGIEALDPVADSRDT